MRKIFRLNLRKQAAKKNADYYGFHRVPGGWVYREWAPGAQKVFLAGDFNNWDWTSHPLLNLGNGSWVLFLPGRESLWDGCRVKTCVDGSFRTPIFARQSLNRRCGMVSDAVCRRGVGQG